MIQLITAVILAITVVGASAQDGISLNNYFSDGMILQRGVENIIWGYGTFDGHIQTTCVLRTGEKILGELKPVQVSANVWEVVTKQAVEHTRCTFTFSDSLILEDVVYGDVWLCSGQSNMEQNMYNILNGQEEIANSAEYAYGVRFASVANVLLTEADLDHNQDMQLSWSRADNSDALKYMSAVCFLYGRNLFDVTDIPMGMVNSDWGGTRVEAWSSPEVLESCDVPENHEGEANADSVLWNGMINPLLRVAVKGFLWYQGEANGNYNRDLYNCTFPAMIEDWRQKFSPAGTSIDAPFGFVQLASWRPDTLDLGFPVIRWHLTADIGIVPNQRMPNVFMSSPLDTYDPQEGYPGGIHPRYKQIVAERLANAGLNVAYGLQDYPKFGPFPEALTQEAGDDFKTVTLAFDSDLQYLEDAEISGFHFCAESTDKCDEGSSGDKWMDIAKDRVSQVDKRTIRVDLSEFETVLGGSIAYIWRETPVKELYMLPIYSDDQFRMPTPPFKFDLA